MTQGALTLAAVLLTLVSMYAVSCSEARANLDAMIDKVVADRAPLAITLRRGEGAVLISASDWASIDESLGGWLLPCRADLTLEAVRHE